MHSLVKWWQWEIFMISDLDLRTNGPNVEFDRRTPGITHNSTNGDRERGAWIILRHIQSLSSNCEWRATIGIAKTYTWTTKAIHAPSSILWRAHQASTPTAIQPPLKMLSAFIRLTRDTKPKIRHQSSNLNFLFSRKLLLLLLPSDLLPDSNPNAITTRPANRRFRKILEAWKIN